MKLFMKMTLKYISFWGEVYSNYNRIKYISIEEKIKYLELTKMKRTDSWSLEDDRILATTIIESVSKGLTQGKGFEEAADRLTRSSAACGFRWNSVVRKQYENELNEAKASRKKNEESIQKVVVSNATEEIKKTTEGDPFEILSDLLQNLKEELQYYKLENENLRKQLEAKPKTEDLGALMQLFEKARNLGLLDNRQNPAM